MRVVSWASTISDLSTDQNRYQQEVSYDKRMERLGWLSFALTCKYDLIVEMALLMASRLSIALELAKHNPTYEDIASKVSKSTP